MNLIFDLDGTLLYTLEDLKNAVNFSLEKLKFPTRSVEEIRAAVGDGLKMLMARALPEGTSDDTLEQALGIMKQYYTAHCMEQTVPYEGVLDMLKCFKARGHTLCIVSNKAHELVQVLKEKFFGDLVDLALGESVHNAKKPSADMVRACIEAFGDDAVYIGDSEVDIQTAQNADIACICVAWGYRCRDFLIKNGANRIADSPLALIDMV